MSFSETQIAGMLQAYEADYHTGMDLQAVAAEIYAYTSGYPVLVSAVCKYIDEELSYDEEFDSQQPYWYSSGVLRRLSERYCLRIFRCLRAWYAILMIIWK